MRRCPASRLLWFLSSFVGEMADHNMDCMPVCGQHMRIFPRVLCQQAAIVRSVKDPNEVILVVKTEKQRLAHGVSAIWMVIWDGE